MWLSPISPSISACGTSAATAIYSASVAYNVSKQLNKDGTIKQFYKNDNGTFDLGNISMYNRTGLLDLSDPKYSASLNNVCTFYNDFAPIFNGVATKAINFARFGVNKSRGESIFLSMKSFISY